MSTIAEYNPRRILPGGMRARSTEQYLNEDELRLFNKARLVEMATNAGLTSSGFNGRVRSKMKKQDLIKFIVSHNPPTNPSTNPIAVWTIGNIEVVEELKTLTKSELRSLARLEGLTASGFNGRPRSRMRKLDLVEFIVTSNTADDTHLTQDHQIDSSSTRRQVMRSELLRESGDDDLFNEIVENVLLMQMQEMYPEDGIMFFGGEGGVRSNIFNVIELFVNTFRQQRKTQALQLEERVPNEEDEEVPDLDIEKISDEVKINVKNLQIKTTCVICQTNVRNIVFAPCNHLVACIKCSKDPNMGDKCPLCRKQFTSITRVFS
jgi:hypothetical protein